MNAPRENPDYRNPGGVILAVVLLGVGGLMESTSRYVAGTRWEVLLVLVSWLLFGLGLLGLITELCRPCAPVKRKD